MVMLLYTFMHALLPFWMKLNIWPSLRWLKPLPSLHQLMLNRSSRLLPRLPICDAPAAPGPTAMPTAGPATEPPVLTLFHSMVTRARKGIFKPRYPIDLAFTTLLSALITNFDLHGFKSAAKFLEWLTTMQVEIDVLCSNHTWDLVPRPLGTNIVG